MLFEIVTGAVLAAGMALYALRIWWEYTDELEEINGERF